MKKVILRSILVPLLLALIVGSNFVTNQIDRLDKLQAKADELLSQQRYDEALPAYGQLLQKTPISFFNRDKAYLDRGVEGVTASVDGLLETLEGAHYLAGTEALDQVLLQATHPALPETFRADLKERVQRGEALLEAEAERLRQEQVAREAAEAEARRRQALLDQALAARAQGQLEEAVELVKQSGLQPELIAEIEAEIETKRIKENDDRLSAEARAALSELRLSDALALAAQVIDEPTRTALLQELNDGWAQMGPQLREKYGDRLWAGAWYTLALGDAPHLTGDRRYEGLDADLAADDRVVGGMFGWMKLTGGRVALVGDTLGASKAVAEITDAVGGAMGFTHALVLHQDGTVTNLGAWQYGRNAAAEWTGIVQVAAGAFHSLGLTREGTVAAAGVDLDGQCKVGEWTDVTAVAAGLRHSVALLKDGHVAATGDNSFGQCDVSGWENVVAVRCGGNFTLGLTADGRLLAAGDNGCGQCDVSGWENVVAFDGGLWHTVALLQDGRLVAAGANGHSQCALQGVKLYEAGGNDAPAGTFAEKETEFVYTGDPFNGPWLYYGGDGSVIVTFDVDTGRMKATLADLICTYGHPPVGILSGGGDKPRSAVNATVLAKQNRAVFALTGDYFTFGYNADGLQIRRGTVFKQEKDEKGFGFYPDGTMRIIDPHEVTAEELLALGVNDSWVFGPTLIEHGEALDIHKHPLAYNDVTMRSVMASICPYHHVGAAYGYSTLAQVVENLLSYGCDVAYNLDGGRSSMLVFMGKAVNKSVFLTEGWRGLQDMVGFLTSELVPEAAR